jgi:hypothetical protein
MSKFLFTRCFKTHTCIMRRLEEKDEEPMTEKGDLEISKI